MHDNLDSTEIFPLLQLFIQHVEIRTVISYTGVLKILLYKFLGADFSLKKNIQKLFVNAD